MELALIPWSSRSTPPPRRSSRREPSRFPAAERPAFQRDFLPALSRSVPALTPDPALALPAVTPPRLVLELTFDEGGASRRASGLALGVPLNPFDADPEHESGVQHLPAFGYPGEEGGEVRDERFEARVLRSVRSVLAAHPALASLEERRIEGLGNPRTTQCNSAEASPHFRCSGALQRHPARVRSHRRAHRGDRHRGQFARLVWAGHRGEGE